MNVRIHKYKTELCWQRACLNCMCGFKSLRKKSLTTTTFATKPVVILFYPSRQTFKNLTTATKKPTYASGLVLLFIPVANPNWLNSDYLCFLLRQKSNLTLKEKWGLTVNNFQCFRSFLMCFKYSYGLEYLWLWCVMTLTKYHLFMSWYFTPLV